eukprot:jgi/Mesen1/8814/ME000053S08222
MASVHDDLNPLKLGESELDIVSKYSEIVPDTVIGDDFSSFPPTAATVSSSLLLGITGLPEAKFDGAIESALAYGQCYLEEKGTNRMSCFIDKALVNVGTELAAMVPGRVSTEVRTLAKLYNEVEVPQDRVLFRIPATWQGIEAARQLEDDGIQTHVVGVYSFAQAAAAAQAGVAVIQISLGRIRDWARTNSGDEEIDAAKAEGKDPGIELVTRVHKHITKLGHKTKVMASALRSKDDIFSLLGLDYLIVPMQKWDEAAFKAQVGQCATQLLDGELEATNAQHLRVEEHFSKIWPPPNV